MTPRTSKEKPRFPDPLTRFSAGRNSAPGQPFASMFWESLQQWAGEEIEAVLESLPEEIGAAAHSLVIFVEDVPSGSDRESGIGADWLGIFEGASVRDPHSPHPPRIRVWTGNLWRHSGANEARFRAEVRVTVLHEIGHFLGLDEIGVARLGLA